ncbi:MAG: hypothetical protein GDA36_03500 [Rhodobacteraceae bacterium]|nr:hypothetical protein [Paracoccaceae bacterium]
MVLACRFLLNPHRHTALRPLDGHDGAVVNYIRTVPHFEPLFERVRTLLAELLPA